MNYKITAFDETNAQITLKVENFPPVAVDLPIDQNGNLPTGDELYNYLRGFIPTWHLERQEKIAQGIANAEEIAALVEPETPVDLSDTDLALAVRTQRNQLLALSDWTQLADVNLSDLEKAAWISYRQDLRNITDQASFPSEVVWPISPLEEPR
jgi:hypothetical protein